MDEKYKEYLTEEEIARASGGIDHLEGKKAKVYTLNGSELNMYRSQWYDKDPFWKVPNGTEMEVDPTLVPKRAIFADVVLSSGYLACYNYRWLFLREDEIRIQWL